MYIDLHVNYTLLLKLGFSRQMLEKYILNFIKVLRVGAKLFFVDGRIGRHHEAKSRFSQIFSTPKKELLSMLKAQKM